MKAKGQNDASPAGVASDCSDLLAAADKMMHALHRCVAEFGGLLKSMGCEYTNSKEAIEALAEYSKA